MLNIKCWYKFNVLPLQWFEAYYLVYIVVHIISHITDSMGITENCRTIYISIYSNAVAGDKSKSWQVEYARITCQCEYHRYSHTCGDFLSRCILILLLIYWVENYQMLFDFIHHSSFCEPFTKWITLRYCVILRKNTPDQRLSYWFLLCGSIFSFFWYILQL